MFEIDSQRALISAPERTLFFRNVFFRRTIIIAIKPACKETIIDRFISIIDYFYILIINLTYL